jgi:hypothetical protein
MHTSLTQLIGAAFGDTQPQPLRPVAGRRRKKVWELPQRWHCALVGTCLPVAEMRKLAARCGFDERDMSDYTLHTAVVCSCDTRTEFAEALQRFLEKRHAAAVARFSRAKGERAVLDLWAEALAAGNDVAGALWAAWSHADLGDDAGKTIYGDLHMLSHQVGAAVRADLRQLEQLKLDNARLRDEAQALRIGLSSAQREKDRVVADLQRRLADAEQRAALLGRRELELAEARKATRDYATVLDRANALARRVETLEERNAANARRAQDLATELNDSQDALAAAEAALEMALGIGGCEGVAGNSGCGRSCPAEAQLAGRCVLCIGGRTNLVDGYRRLVETRGGRFLHHDGGQEESLHRIDAAIAGADAVVCQSGCVSHAAYWRLKEACKKLGKPCVFLKSPGVGSFARGLAALSGGAREAGAPPGGIPLLVVN